MNNLKYEVGEIKFRHGFDDKEYEDYIVLKKVKRRIKALKDALEKATEENLKVGLCLDIWQYGLDWYEVPESKIEIMIPTYPKLEKDGGGNYPESKYFPVVKEIIENKIQSLEIYKNELVEKIQLELNEGQDDE